MSRSGEIRLQIGFDTYTLRLRIREWERLDAELQAGPYVLLCRAATGQTQVLQALALAPGLAGEVSRFRPAEPRHVLMQGLIGGGMDHGKAVRLVQAAESDAGLGELAGLAFQVLLAALVGVVLEDPAGAPLGEPQGAAEPPTPSQTGASASAPTASTAKARRSASRQGKSTNSVSGSSPPPSAAG